MSTKAHEITQKEVEERLSKIAFYFEERNSVRKNLERFTEGDYKPASPQFEEMKRVLDRIESAELSLLSELVHLTDNVKKYFKAHGLNQKELAVRGAF